MRVRGEVMLHGIHGGEAIFEQGREVVIEALVGMARRIEELAQIVQ